MRLRRLLAFAAVVVAPPAWAATPVAAPMTATRVEVTAAPSGAASAAVGAAAPTASGEAGAAVFTAPMEPPLLEVDTPPVFGAPKSVPSVEAVPAAAAAPRVVADGEPPAPLPDAGLALPPPGNEAPPDSEALPPLVRPYTPIRSRAEIEAERMLFPGLASPDDPAPGGAPRLLSPATPRDLQRRPLVLAPTLSTREPIPGAGAGNCVRRDERGRFMGWMDHQQCVFSGRAMVTARWIDDFFGDWHDDEATMQARLVFHSLLTESEGLENKVTLRASARLPNARQRMRLIISDETDDDPVNQSQRNRFGQEDSRVSAALRWMSLERHGMESNFDVGARGINPTDLFARYRLRKTWSLTDDSIARLTQTLRYGSDSKERYTPVLDLERAIGERSVLRLGNYYDYRHESSGDGFNWNHSISLSKALRNSRSFSYGVSLNGKTEPQWRGDAWGPWFIYRRPFLRPWLYYEVEPHYTWHRDRDWDGLASLLLRVEMQFGWTGQ